MTKGLDAADLAQLIDEMARMTAPAEEITEEILSQGAAEPLVQDARERLQGGILARLGHRPHASPMKALRAAWAAPGGSSGGT